MTGRTKGQPKQGQLWWNPLIWVLFLLSSIGRATYKLLFLILKSVYIFFYYSYWFFQYSFRYKTLSYSFGYTSLVGFLKTSYWLVFSTLFSIQIYTLIVLNSTIAKIKKFFSLLSSLSPNLNRDIGDPGEKAIDTTPKPFHKLNRSPMSISPFSRIGSRITIEASLKSFLKTNYLFWIPLYDNAFIFLINIFSFTESFLTACLYYLASIGKSLFAVKKTTRYVFSWYSLILVVLGGGALTVFSFYILVLKDLPNPNELLTRQQILTTKIYSRDGKLLYNIYRNQNRSLIQLKDLPSLLVNATVAAEDRNFWDHPGFSLTGIMRAFSHNLSDGDSLQGGSTITQQLVKNALLSPEQTFTRKLKELVLAIEVELLLSKEEILQLYFNEIPYGGVAYGIEEAAQTYLGKSAQELNIAEAALLAGLPIAPTRYSPLGANPQYSIYRQHQVLDRMVEDGYISFAEAKKAKKTKITIKPPQNPILAPHFVMYVKDVLVEKYGTRMVEEGGLKVITSIDLDLQEKAQKAANEELEKLKGMNVTNAAVMITHPYSGEILAMVGSHDYFDTAHDGNVNVALQLRQPGSSIKPITYALALKSGMSPYTIIQDTPVSYPDGPGRWYTPVNYDGTFHGSVTLKTALGSSFNIPAVKLIDQLGVNRMVDLAESMGITTWEERNRFGLSLTLGGGEVRMVDMAVVYGVFANAGLRVNLQPILEVQKADGSILESFSCQKDFQFLPTVEAASSQTYCNPISVLEPEVTYQISQILSDDTARMPAFGPNSLLNIPGHQVAVKTGTTNDKRDNWTIGYTPDFVVVVWVGNNNNTPMSAVASGITGASPIWNHVMTSLVKNEDQPIHFNAPSSLIPVEVCATNGLLPCASCPQRRIEYFVPGTEPRQTCNDSKPQRNQSYPSITYPNQTPYPTPNSEPPVYYAPQASPMPPSTPYELYLEDVWRRDRN